MTTLTLTTVAIAPVSDLTDILLIDPNAESETTTAPVQVRRYAGGRDRIVTTPGQTQTIAVSFPQVSRTQYAALLDLVGTLVLYRDQRGRAVYGVVADVTGTEWDAANVLSDVSFTLTSVTHSEVV